MSWDLWLHAFRIHTDAAARVRGFVRLWGQLRSHKQGMAGIFIRVCLWDRHGFKYLTMTHGKIIKLWHEFVPSQFQILLWVEVDLIIVDIFAHHAHSPIQLGDLHGSFASSSGDDAIRGIRRWCAQLMMGRGGWRAMNAHLLYKTSIWIHKKQLCRLSADERRILTFT